MTRLWCNPGPLLAGAVALLAAAGSVQAADAEVARGEREFRRQCAGCHSVEPGDHRAGPSLHGVVGRTAGAVPGFEFSPGLREAEFTWTAEILDGFLADPSAMFPDTRMVFWGLEAEARAKVIRYLEHLGETAEAKE